MEIFSVSPHRVCACMRDWLILYLLVQNSTVRLILTFAWPLKIFFCIWFSHFYEWNLCMHSCGEWVELLTVLIRWITNLACFMTFYLLSCEKKILYILFLVIFKRTNAVMLLLLSPVLLLSGTSSFCPNLQFIWGAQIGTLFRIIKEMTTLTKITVLHHFLE